MRQYTEAEVKAFAEAEPELRRAGLDVDHEGSTHNANLTLEYFEKNLGIPVTVENIYALVNQRPHDFKWRTPAQREYDKIASENPTAAAQLAEWLATQGKPGQLVNTGDEAFVNSSLLLVELRGREVNPQRIYEAMGRISYRPGRQLYTIPMPRKVDPRQHKDDGSGFLSKKDVNKSPRDYKKEAEAAYADPKLTLAKVERTPDAWETLCNQLLNYGTHGAQVAMRQIYDRGISQRKSFREIYSEMNELKKSRERLLPTARY